MRPRLRKHSAQTSHLWQNTQSRYFQVFIKQQNQGKFRVYRATNTSVFLVFSICLDNFHTLLNLFIAKLFTHEIKNVYATNRRKRASKKHNTGIIMDSHTWQCVRCDKIYERGVLYIFYLLLLL
jgi:hypothetical protein